MHRPTSTHASHGPDHDPVDHVPSATEAVALRSLVASLAITAVGVLPGFLVSANAVQIRAELAISTSMFGLILAAFFAVGGLGAPLGGRLADRLGWRRGVGISAILSACTLVGFATIVDSPTALLLVLVLGGVTLGLTGPTGNLVLADEMPAHRLGLVFGVKQSAIPVATIFAGFAVPLIALSAGWRWTFVGGLVFAALAVATTGSVRRAAPGSIRQGHRVPLDASADLVLVGIAGGLAMTAAGGMAAFLVTSAVDLGVSEGAAGTLFAVASLVGLTVRVVAGQAADRTRSLGFRPASVMMLGGAIGYVLLATRMPALLVPGVVLAFGCGWSWAGLMNYGIVRTHPAHVATATGTVQLGTTLGVAAGPIVLGVTADLAGYRAMWIVAAASAACGAGIMAVAARRLGTRDTIGSGFVPR